MTTNNNAFEIMEVTAVDQVTTVSYGYSIGLTAKIRVIKDDQPLVARQNFYLVISQVGQKKRPFAVTIGTVKTARQKSLTKSFARDGRDCAGADDYFGTLPISTITLRRLLTDPLLPEEMRRDGETVLDAYEIQAQKQKVVPNDTLSPPTA